MTEPASRQLPGRRSVIVLGATGRLGPTFCDALRQSGYRPVRAGRSKDAELPGIDLRERHWWSPTAWDEQLHRGGVPAQHVAAVVSFVAGKDDTVAAAARTGEAAISALVAIRDCARAAGATPTTVHVGSVAELRDSAQLSPYASEKRAARAAARRAGTSAILTVGVVPRPRHHHSDSLVRRFAELEPRAAAVPLGVSSAAEVGSAVTALVDQCWPLAPTTAPVEVVLAARRQSLAGVLGTLPRRPSWYAGATLRLLAGTHSVRLLPRLERVGSLARIARASGDTGNHYLAAVPPTPPPPPVARLGPFRVAPRTGDELGDHWLLTTVGDEAGDRA